MDGSSQSFPNVREKGEWAPSIFLGMGGSHRPSIKERERNDHLHSAYSSLMGGVDGSPLSSSINPFSSLGDGWVAGPIPFLPSRKARGKDVHLHPSCSSSRDGAMATSRPPNAEGERESGGESESERERERDREREPDGHLHYSSPSLREI